MSLVNLKTTITKKLKNQKSMTLFNLIPLLFKNCKNFYIYIYIYIHLSLGVQILQCFQGMIQCLQKTTETSQPPSISAVSSSPTQTVLDHLLSPLSIHLKHQQCKPHPTPAHLENEKVQWNESIHDFIIGQVQKSYFHFHFQVGIVLF